MEEAIGRRDMLFTFSTSSGKSFPLVLARRRRRPENVSLSEMPLFRREEKRKSLFAARLLSFHGDASGENVLHCLAPPRGSTLG